MCYNTLVFIFHICIPVYLSYDQILNHITYIQLSWTQHDVLKIDLFHDKNIIALHVCLFSKPFKGMTDL